MLGPMSKSSFTLGFGVYQRITGFCVFWSAGWFCVVMWIKCFACWWLGVFNGLSGLCGLLCQLKSGVLVF